MLFFALLLLSSPLVMAQGAYTHETPAQKAQRLKWWTDARFGMFIHWGVYSRLNGEYKGQIQKDPKGEWIMRNLKIPVKEYEQNVAKKFNPVDFNADRWVKLAKEAGMKYIVITAKHHDGFALFHSKVSPYNIVDDTPFKRDVIKEMADACRKNGIRFGVYYSQAQDWHHPGGLAPDKRWDKAQQGDWVHYFETIVKGQVTELFTRYGKISIMWWDSGRAVQNKEVADSLGKELVKLQPGIIVNSRLGGHLKGDFNTFEQVIPGVVTKKYNELCLTHNRSWSYRKPDTAWKSPQFLLKTLVQMASLGSNFLLNVGPGPDGNIPQPTVEALKYIGRWMKVNGNSIYGTHASPFYKPDFGTATWKTENGVTKLFLQVFHWPKEGKLFVKGLHNTISKAFLLSNGKPVTAHTKKNGVLLTGLPEKAPDPDDVVSVIELDMKGILKADPGYIKPSQDQSVLLTPFNALLTIKPQYDYIPEIVGKGKEAYFDNWRRHYPHSRFKNTGNAANWKTELPQNGVYRVIATVATRNNTNVVTFGFGKNKLKKTLPDTGGMDHFKKVDLGTLPLKKGVNLLTFTGGGKQETWDYVWLRNIRLERVK